MELFSNLNYSMESTNYTGLNKTTFTEINGTANDSSTELKPGPREYLLSIIDGVRVTNYLIGVLGVILNVLTLTALLKIKGPLKLRLKLLASLALSDLIIACLSIPYYDFCFYQFWKILGTDGCSTEGGEPFLTILLKLMLMDIFTIAQYAGLSTMFAICIDLLYAVRKPFRYHQLSRSSRGYIIVILLWAIPAAIQCIVSTAVGYSKLKPGHNVKPELSIITPTLYFPLSTLCVIPFIVIYTCIICKLRQQYAMTPSTQNRNLRKIVCTSMIVIGTYLVCMMPYVWLILLIMFPPFEGGVLIVLSAHTLRLLYVSNTLWDPIIFSIRVPEIRKGIARLWKNAMCSSCKTQTRSRTMTIETTCPNTPL